MAGRRGSRRRSRGLFVGRSLQGCIRGRFSSGRVSDPPLLGGRGLQAVDEAGVAAAHLVVGYGHVDGGATADEDAQLFGAGDGGVEEVALKHDVVFGGEDDYGAGVFSALGFVDGDGVGEDELVGEFFEGVGEWAEAVEFDDGLGVLVGGVGVDAEDAADVAVEDVFVVVVAGLHDSIS